MEINPSRSRRISAAELCSRSEILAKASTQHKFKHPVNPNPTTPAKLDQLTVPLVGDIREYRPHDESTCLSIFDSNRPKYFTASERDLFTAFLRRMDQPFFVTEIAGQIRACGGFHVDDYGVGILDWGMVHADCHRQGVGAILLKYRLERIRQTTHAWCVLIDTSQHTAPFFARFGFEAYRTIPDGYQPGLDKIFMRLVWAPHPVAHSS